MRIEKTFEPEKFRAALTHFWDSALSIERTPEGFAVAMPQTDADGWQILLEIREILPGKVRVTDSGRTLGSLTSAGQNIEAAAVKGHIESILQASRMECDGLEIYRWLPFPIDAMDIHVFAEALSQLSLLRVLHEPTVRRQDVADRTLQAVFVDRKISARAGAVLSGRTEKAVRVDYLVETNRPVAFEILRRRGRLLPVMEQWGYRWQDLRKENDTLMPVMLYDPALQDVDEASRAIGEEVCSLFCSYDETARIHAVLAEAQRDSP